MASAESVSSLDQKRSLRRAMNDRRAQLTVADRQQAAGRAAERLLSLKEVDEVARRAGCVAGFARSCPPSSAPASRICGPGRARSTRGRASAATRSGWGRGPPRRMSSGRWSGPGRLVCTGSRSSMSRAGPCRRCAEACARPRPSRREHIAGRRRIRPASALGWPSSRPRRLRRRSAMPAAWA